MCCACYRTRTHRARPSCVGLHGVELLLGFRKLRAKPQHEALEFLLLVEGTLQSGLYVGDAQCLALNCRVCTRVFARHGMVGVHVEWQVKVQQMIVLLDGCVDDDDDESFSK